ncbi:MAG: hypothetical protein H3C27_15440 [Opitutaceae bacterium]|nr:hypothetical protein [Opitutaceae bacterium]
MPGKVTVNEKAMQVSELLKAKDLTLHDLALKARVSVSAIRFLLYRYQNNPRLAWKVECALGRVPIWTSVEHFQQLTAASDFLGTDFILTRFHALRRQANAKGVPGTRAITNKRDLLAAVLAHARKQTITPSHP